MEARRRRRALILLVFAFPVLGSSLSCNALLFLNTTLPTFLEECRDLHFAGSTCSIGCFRALRAFAAGPMKPCVKMLLTEPSKLAPSLMSDHRRGAYYASNIQIPLLGPFSMLLTNAFFACEGNHLEEGQPVVVEDALSCSKHLMETFEGGIVRLFLSACHGINPTSESINCSRACMAAHDAFATHPCYLQLFADKDALARKYPHDAPTASLLTTVAGATRHCVRGMDERGELKELCSVSEFAVFVDVKLPALTSSCAFAPTVDVAHLSSSATAADDASPPPPFASCPDACRHALHVVLEDEPCLQHFEDSFVHAARAHRAQYPRGGGEGQPPPLSSASTPPLPPPQVQGTHATLRSSAVSAATAALQRHSRAHTFLAAALRSCPLLPPGSMPQLSPSLQAILRKLPPTHTAHGDGSGSDSGASGASTANALTPGEMTAAVALLCALAAAAAALVLLLRRQSSSGSGTALRLPPARGGRRSGMGFGGGAPDTDTATVGSTAGLELRRRG